MMICKYVQTIYIYVLACEGARWTLATCCGGCTVAEQNARCVLWVFRSASFIHWVHIHPFLRFSKPGGIGEPKIPDSILSTSVLAPPFNVSHFCVVRILAAHFGSWLPFLCHCGNSKQTRLLKTFHSGINTANVATRELTADTEPNMVGKQTQQTSCLYNVAFKCKQRDCMCQLSTNRWIDDELEFVWTFVQTLVARLHANAEAT